MKLSDIVEELAKLNGPEQDSDAAEKAELEKLLMAHPEVTDEMMLSALREAAEAVKTDPLTAHAREECRRLGIGDYAPHRLNRTKPEVIPEELDEEIGWLHQVLEKRRAMLAAQPKPPPRAPVLIQQPPRSWVRPPRRHGLYAALDDD